MSSYSLNCANFGTLPGDDSHSGSVEDQYWTPNVDANLALHKKNQEIQQIKSGLLRERNTSAFAELFEDLHRYIQQEEQSALSSNQAEYSQSVLVLENESYQCNTFIPVQSIQLPSNTPVSTCPQIKHHSGAVHQAHYSPVPTTSGILNKIVKRKRKRTIFTTDQVEELEGYFSKKPYVNREERQILVNRLQINDKAVKIWFQNRRLKDKRYSSQSPSSEDVTMESNSADIHLDYFESQINKKTDEFGYVTLDDTMMGNLVNIIDSYLGNTNVDRPVEEPTTKCETGPIYEPISPPDSTKEDENSNWEPHEPTESLQRLFDIQSMTH